MSTDAPARRARDTAWDPNLDNDTNQWGTDGPFERWEHDHTGLVHVLWHLRYRGVTLTDAHLDDIATAIMASRWYAAALANPTPRQASLETLRRYSADIDPDTHQHGLSEPMHTWEGDKPALVRVLRYIRSRGLTLTDQADDVASLIMRSRWHAAATAAAAAR